jgi:flagellar hook-associated protein 2
MAVSLSSLQDQINTAGTQYGATLTKPIDALTAQKSDLTSQVNAYDSIRSSMTAMQTSAKALLSTAANTSKFAVYTATSTLTNVVTATATTSDSAGTHALLVTQLAKNDMAVSSRFTNTDTTLAASIGATTKQFQLNVNGVPTTIDIKLDGTETNQGVLSKIAAAINLKSGTSGVSASAVGDTGTTTKLVFTSKSTGSVNHIGLSDVSGGNVLDSIGLTADVISARTQSSSTGAGFTYSDSSKLDAMFNLDGLDITRSSNTVTDALQGVTLSLKSVQQPTDTPSTLTIGLDQTAIKSNVQDFLTKYNNLIGLIRGETEIDTTTKTLQVLSQSTTYVRLRTSLRQMVMGNVSTTKSGNPSRLSALGITADSTGTLSISDLTKFNSVISGNSPAAIADVFTSSNGIAAQISARMNDFVKTNGVLDNDKKGATTRMTAIDKKVAELTARNAQAVSQYKAALAEATTTLSSLTTQQQMATAYVSQVAAGG